MLFFNLKLRYLILIVFLVNFLKPISAQEISDIIQPVSLIAGQTDSVLVSDLFYSSDYNLKFVPNPSIKISYNLSSKKLFLTPDENYEGLTLIEFKLNKITYEIPLRILI